MDTDQLDRYRAKAEECERRALSSDDLAIKLSFVTLALEWHESAKHRWRYLSGGARNRRATTADNAVTLQFNRIIKTLQVDPVVGLIATPR